MKMHLLIETPEGHYHEVEIPCRHIKDGLDKVNPTLDALPDEIDGKKLWDWTKITVTLIRR